VAQALYRKWRPTSFDDVVGQEHVTTTLKNQIATGRIGHAYLFVGSRGCGKTTTARILAKEVNIAGLDAQRAAKIGEAITEGRSLDVIEIDAASHTGVDAMREILDKVSYQPGELKYKVYIIDEVHMLSTSAFNAMLKTLEEPPPHVIFILATTDPQKIPATVLSRCQRFTFKRVPVEKIVGRLRHLCDEENIEADDHALKLIARHATGSLRDAVSLLDQLASSNSLRITAADVREALGATDAATVKALTDGLIAKDISAGYDAIQRAMDQGADARQIARQMVDYLRALMQLKASQRDNAGGELSEAERIELSAHAERLSVSQLSKAARAFSEAINEMRGTTDAQLPLEMAYIDCVLAGSEPAPRVAEPAVQPRSTPRPAPAQPMAEVLLQQQPQTPKTAPPLEQSVPPASATTPSSGSLTLETLKAQWKQFIKEVDAQNKPAAALLRSCHLHDVTGNTVHIRADHDLFRQRLDNANNKNAVIAVLNRMFAGRYELRVFANAAQQDIDPEEDPLVKAAKKLGGTVRS
jgi:DNA polymerase-3 subunit gamma/tau